MALGLRGKAVSTSHRSATRLWLRLVRKEGKIGWRNKVDPFELFYESRNDYEKTRLWKRVSLRIFKRDKFRCRVCGDLAKLIHHRSYEEMVIRGHFDLDLISLCSTCHAAIHFTPGGRRRKLEMTERTLVKFLEARKNRERVRASAQQAVQGPTSPPSAGPRP